NIDTAQIRGIIGSSKKLSSACKGPRNAMFFGCVLCQFCVDVTHRDDFCILLCSIGINVVAKTRSCQNDSDTQIGMRCSWHTKTPVYRLMMCTRGDSRRILTVMRATSYPMGFLAPGTQYCAKSWSCSDC